MPKFKLEEFLLPHEHDGDGKKLDEPKELDIEQLRKWVYGLLTDKEEAQTARSTAETERDAVKADLENLQRQNESDEERRTREQKERDAEVDRLRAESTERRKIEALEEAFPDAPAGRLKRLAKRVTGDEKNWVDDAKELVEDGFKLSDKKAEDPSPADEETDDVSSKPRVRRSDGTAPKPPASRSRSVADELDAAGIASGGTW